jgi:hypothetical protein
MQNAHYKLFDQPLLYPPAFLQLSGKSLLSAFSSWVYTISRQLFDEQSERH